MKKVIIFSILLVSLSGIIFAQGIYFRAGAGYGLPVASSSIGENYLYIEVAGSPQDDENSSESVSASYGAGTNFSFAIGYKFNENLILDINMLYLVGRKFETSDIYSYTDGAYLENDDLTSTSYSRGLFLNPSIIFSSGFGKRAPYARIGIIAAFPKVTEDDYYYAFDGVTDTDDIRWEYGGGMGIGFQTAVGINWEITDKLDIYSEIDFVGMTYYAKEGNRTKYISNGEDILDRFSVFQNNISYEKEYDSSTSYDPTKPQVSLSESRAFSSISAQVGIRLTIWNRKDKLSDY